MRLTEDAIFEALPEQTKQQIHANYAQYAPLLALMVAWKETVYTHLEGFEERVAENLAGRIFPVGEWRFPMQTLAVPRHPTNFHLDPFRTDWELTAPNQGGSWTPCGAGWGRPSRLMRARVFRLAAGRRALVFEIDHDDSAQPLIGAGADGETFAQLAFVQATEPLVAKLSNAEWAALPPGETQWTPIDAARYEGYLDFERGIAQARLRQRQLAAWLPPFYPYSRKFLSFQPMTATQKAAAPPAGEWAGLETGGSAVRIAALLDGPLEQEVNRQARALGGLENLLLLNAVPVMQTRLHRIALQAAPTGETYRATHRNLKGCFGATAHEETIGRDATGAEARETVYHPCEIQQSETDLPGSDPDMKNITIQGDNPGENHHAYQGRIYYDSRGEKVPYPATLTRRQDIFDTPLPPVGGMNLSFTSWEGEGARGFWYHSLLRATQLTAGDVQQTLMEVPVLKKYFDLPSLQLGLDREPWREAAREITPWENALWPSVVTGGATLEMRANYFTASRIALTPVMRLIFKPRPRELGAEMPDYLLDDLARYAASLISRYFMVGWYRIEGEARE